MTLTFRPGGASWDPYTYNLLRARLAEWEGIELGEMDGHGGTVDWDDQSPLVPMFASSDVRGFWSSSDCAKMLPKMRAVLRFHGDSLGEWDRSGLAALISGMEHCAEHGCALSYG